MALFCDGAIDIADHDHDNIDHFVADDINHNDFDHANLEHAEAPRDDVAVRLFTVVCLLRKPDPSAFA